MTQHSHNTNAYVRVVTREDVEGWLALRNELWPGDLEEHRAEIDWQLDQMAKDTDGPGAIHALLAFTRDNPNTAPIGLLEGTIRSHADGCAPGRVIYMEGWIVAEPYRKLGIGKLLVDALCEWGRAKGCVEIASDALIDNDLSFRAHTALGFEEVDRCINFRRSI